MTSRSFPTAHRYQHRKQQKQQKQQHSEKKKEKRNREEEITIQPIKDRQRHTRESCMSLCVKSLLADDSFLSVCCRAGSLFLLSFFLFLSYSLSAPFLFFLHRFLSPPAEMTELRVSCISVVVVVAAGSFTHSSSKPILSIVTSRVLSLSLYMSGFLFCYFCRSFPYKWRFFSPTQFGYCVYLPVCVFLTPPDSLESSDFLCFFREYLQNEIQARAGAATAAAAKRKP